MNKQLFLSRLIREREKLELLVNRIGFTRKLTMPGVLGKWSVKDVIAHLLAHEQYLADRMEEILHGVVYLPCRTQTALDAFLDEFGYPDFGSPLLDDDTPNEWVVERYKNVSLEDVVTQEINVFSSIVSSLEMMSEEMIHKHNIYERVAHGTYKHYNEHIRDIKRWFAVKAPNAKK